MINLKYILILFFIASCAGTSVQENKVDNVVEGIVLDNKDFNSPDPIPYNDGLDFYDSDFDNSGALSDETMANAPTSKLDHFDSSDNPLNEALSLCYRKNFKKAELIFSKLYKSFNKNPVYWNLMGTCDLIRGNRRKALLFYNKSRDLKFDYTPPINNLGVIYQLEGKDQKALSAYKKASNLSKFSLTPLFNLGTLYTKYGLATKAKRIFVSLYNRDPEDQKVISALAYIELISRNFSQALSYYEKMDRDLYKTSKVGVNLSLTLYELGRSKDAKDIVDNIQSSGSDEEVRYLKIARNFFKGKL